MDVVKFLRAAETGKSGAGIGENVENRLARPKASPGKKRSFEKRPLL
jgi:hypothetical protein